MKFIATWYNYIAQGETTLLIEATDYEEATRVALKLMDAMHPHRAPHEEDDISTMHQVREDGYITLNEAQAILENSLRGHKEWEEEEEEEEEEE